MREQGIEPPEAVEGETKTKSGYSVEELFDVVVGLKTMGIKKDPISLVKKKSRGLTKNVLRTAGIDHEGARRLLPTGQTRFIKSEISHMPLDLQGEVMRKLATLERKRVTDSIRQTVTELQEDNLVGVYLYGSSTSENEWPNDVDVKVIMKKKDARLARRLKEVVAKDLHKLFDIKHILLENEINDEIRDNLIVV